MRADRLVALLLLLQARGKMTAQALARSLEVAQRTIYRDIDALSSAGVPIYADGGPGGGFTLDPSYRTSLTGLTSKEVLTLLIPSAPGPLADIGFEQQEQSTLLKLLAVLPELMRAQVEHTRQRLYLDPTNWWQETTSPSTILGVIQAAVMADEQAYGVYERNDGTLIERVLEPYGLVAKAGIWYLVGRHDNMFRTYQVGRFQTFSPLASSFTRDAAFDLGEYWRTQVHTFLADVPTYSCIMWIRSNRLGFLRLYVSGQVDTLATPESGLWLQVRITVGERDAAQMIALGLGKDAWVEEPVELRESVMQSAAEVLEHSANSSAFRPF